MQMGGSVTASISDASLPTAGGEQHQSAKKGGAVAGGKAMNIEELRINKQLLKEISKRKKAKLAAGAESEAGGA